jgi:hypothetical protein
MFKVHRIITGATVTLLAAFGFIMIVWAHGRSAPPPARVDIATVRAVKLRLTFASGDSANVIQVEGAAINIEKDGKKLAITPFIHEQSGQVELRISEAVQRQGREEMQALDTLLVDKNLTKLNHGDVPLTVQVLDLDKQLPAEFLAGGTGTCCATTCNGTVICGVCVCTDCGRCGPGWCDCAIPGPPDE